MVVDMQAGQVMVQRVLLGVLHVHQHRDRQPTERFASAAAVGVVPREREREETRPTVTSLR